MDERYMEAILTLDLKKNRFRVNRQTLMAIGMPKHIMLMIDPKTMTLGVKGSSQPQKQVYTQAATLWQKDRSRSVEVYSKSLVEQLRGLVPELETAEVYHLHGRIFPAAKVALFSLHSAEKVVV